MSNQFIPPLCQDYDDDDDAVVYAPFVLTVDVCDERPLDPDLDADAIDSAAADERAATTGTIDDGGEGDVIDDRP